MIVEELNYLARGVEFHGHLGPYAVIGFRMGEIANERLTDHPFKKKALVKTGTKPSISCIIDGIQLSSCCTLGKGMIEVTDEKIPEATFTTGGKTLIIRLKDEIWGKIRSGIPDSENDEYSKQLFSANVEELFEISTDTN